MSLSGKEVRILSRQPIPESRATGSYSGPQVLLWSWKSVSGPRDGVLKRTRITSELSTMGGETCPRFLMSAAFRSPFRGFSFDVQSMSLAVCCPFFFQRAGLILRRDFEPGQRQDQGAHADTRFRSMPRPPTPAASNDRRLDVPAGPNPMKRFV